MSLRLYAGIFAGSSLMILATSFFVKDAIQSEDRLFKSSVLMTMATNIIFFIASVSWIIQERCCTERRRNYFSFFSPTPNNSPDIENRVLDRMPERDQFYEEKP